MEMEEIQNNGRMIGHKGDEQYQDDEEDAGEITKRGNLCDVARFCGWPSSRIVRVSRASGGKDRHSKVWTSKGLRDRRVRLSVNTAIQFYDLQDRLGYDQPSKAVEWLLKAAAPSISELPPLEAFPDTMQLSDEKRSSAGTEPGFDSAEVEMDDDDDPNYHHQQQPCSSNSKTSKGSGLSLSRSENRIKARERAKGRAVKKEKEKENESGMVAHHQNMHPSSSFTELLTGGLSNNNNNNNTSPDGSVHQNTPRHWAANPLEYFTLGPSTTRGIDNSSAYSGQIHLGNPLQPMFSITGDHHPELQHFPFVGGDNLVTPGVTAGGGNNSNEYNLNFSISSSSSASSFAGFNRGTLQSNSSSASQSILQPHFQRFNPIDGSQSLFLGTTMAANPNASASSADNHHPIMSVHDARLQLFYGNGNRHYDQKGKGKN